MPLGNVDALYQWAEDEDPPYSVWRPVEQWVLGLDTTPWQWPSTPLTLASGGPFEIRAVIVPSTNVEVTYEHWHATAVVNLLTVGRPDQP